MSAVRPASPRPPQSRARSSKHRQNQRSIWGQDSGIPATRRATSAPADSRQAQRPETVLAAPTENKSRREQQENHANNPARDSTQKRSPPVSPSRPKSPPPRP